MRDHEIVKHFGTDVVSADEISSGKHLTKQFAFIQILTIRLLGVFLAQVEKKIRNLENSTEISTQ